jgi:hypothetical protein
MPDHLPRTRVRARRLAPVLAAALGALAVAAPAQAALTAVGPTDADGFPAWYQDSTGLQLERCTDAANCAIAVGDPAAAGESFYWSASATLPQAELVLALEATDAAAPDPALTFGRIQVRSLAALSPNTTYRLVHPYGTEIVTTDGAGDFARFREEIGCAPEPGADCAFGDALGTGIGPFLRWDPSVAAGAPAGFLGMAGTAGVDHKVVGSPIGENEFRIELLDGTVVSRTDDFQLDGQIVGGGAQTPLASVQDKAEGFRATQVGQSDVQTVTIRNDSTVASPLNIAGSAFTGANAGEFRIASTTCGASLAPSAPGAPSECTVSIAMAPGSAGAKNATLDLGLPAGSFNRVTLAGSATPAPAAALAPAANGGAGAAGGPGVVAGTRRLTIGASMARTISRRVLARRGLLVNLRIARGTKVVQLRLVKVLSGGRTRVVYRSLRTVRRTGRVQIRLSSRTIKRLSSGRYRLEVRPGANRSSLQAAKVLQFRVR